MSHEQPDDFYYLDLMCYLQQLETIEQPGVGLDQPEEGSRYLETESVSEQPVDYSIPEKGEKKISNVTLIHSCNPPKCVLPFVTIFMLSAM